MGKKIRSRAKYTSKGQRKSAASSARVKKSYADTLLAKQAAFVKGKKVFITIANPNPNETNKRFIRVEMKTQYPFDYRTFNERVIQK